MFARSARVVALYGSGPIRLRACSLGRACWRALVTDIRLLANFATPPRRRRACGLAKAPRAFSPPPRRTLLHSHPFRGGF